MKLWGCYATVKIVIPPETVQPTKYGNFDKNFNDIANDDDMKQQDRLCSPKFNSREPVALSNSWLLILHTVIRVHHNLLMRICSLDQEKTR